MTELHMPSNRTPQHGLPTEPGVARAKEAANLLVPSNAAPSSSQTVRPSIAGASLQDCKRLHSDKRNLARTRGDIFHHADGAVRPMHQLEQLSHVGDERAAEAQISRHAVFEEREVLLIQREASSTTQHVLGSILATCDAGFESQHLARDFESCRLTIHNLPFDTSTNEISDLVVAQGIGRHEIHILSIGPATRNYVEAEVLIQGHAVAPHLSRIQFKNELLRFEISRKSDTRMESAAQPPDTLTITWSTPSITAVYCTLDGARLTAKQLDGIILDGRKIKANIQPPGWTRQWLAGPEFCYYEPSCMKIGEMPMGETSTVVLRTGAAVVEVSLDARDLAFREVLRIFREYITPPPDSGVASLDPAKLATNGIVTVKIRFKSSEHAERVRASLEGRRLRPDLPYSRLSLSQPLRLTTVDASCFVCRQTVSHPVQLGCKHVYCTACIWVYAISAARTKIFPLICVGNGANRKASIAVHALRRFFDHQQYEHLISVAFSEHLASSVFSADGTQHLRDAHTAEENAARLTEQLEAIRNAKAEAKAGRKRKAREKVAWLVREAERERVRLAAEEAARIQEVKRLEEAARQAVLARQEALQIETDAAFTTQHIVPGSTLITCGAGLEIRDVISGFESCRLIIHNLPFDAKASEIAELFTQQGMSRDHIHILSINPAGEHHLEAEVLTSAAEGRTIAVGLQGIEFRNETLGFEIIERFEVTEATREPSVRQTDTLTITWSAPSATMIATYTTREEAQVRAKDLDRRIICGRRIRAKVSKWFAGATLCDHSPTSVQITGLPTTHASIYAVIMWARVKSVLVTRPRSYDLPNMLKLLREHMALLPDHGIRSFYAAERVINGIVTAKVRFESWDHADRARAYLEGKRLRADLPYFHLSLPQPLRLITMVGTMERICPICYDIASHPLELGCKHAYCTGCIQHYVMSAVETKIFPLVCIGNQANCKVPIPIPIIQQFATQTQYERLVGVAFTTYLNQHPREFRHCPTPGCEQIYRINSAMGIRMNCRSCFAVVCSSCHEAHPDRMTCKERKEKEEDRLNECWAKLHGAKRCPSCQVWLEKTEGCNHMTCRCGAHLCWICVKNFPAKQIYKHLRDVHGGAFDVDPEPRDNILQHAVAMDHPFNEQQEPINPPLADAPPVVEAVQAPVENGFAPPAARAEAERRRRFGGRVRAMYGRILAGRQQRGVQRQAHLAPGAQRRPRQEGCIIM